MMWPSTCASSLETWLRLNHQCRAPTASRPARATPMSAKAMPRRPRGLGAGAGAGAPAESRRMPELV